MPLAIALLSVKVVGSLLTAALVAIAPAAVRSVSKNLRQYAFGSMAADVVSSLLGIVQFELHRPAGPLIILVSTAIFLVTVLR